MSTDSNSLHTSPDILVNPMQNVALSPSAVTDTTSSDTSLSPIRPFISYTQAQILLLYKSPLVSPPPGMPFFKDWFGYAFLSTFSTIPGLYSPSVTGMNKMPRKRTLIPRQPRERGTNGMSYLEHGFLCRPHLSILASDVIKKMLVRSPSLPFVCLYTLTAFLADLPPRSTFRSTLSQPSQMGNFKLSSRTSEREKDKDADRDRERDLRDKEGQERLRNVSSWLLRRSPSNQIRSFLINTTGIAFRLLLALPVCGPESVILHPIL